MSAHTMAWALLLCARVMSVREDGLHWDDPALSISQEALRASPGSDDREERGLDGLRSGDGARKPLGAQRGDAREVDLAAAHQLGKHPFARGASSPVSPVGQMEVGSLTQKHAVGHVDGRKADEGIRESLTARRQRNESLQASNSSDHGVPPGRKHEEAKYHYKASTAGMEDLRVAVEQVDAAKDSAVEKAKTVDKSFSKQQRRIKELGEVLDHLAVSAQKFELSVVDFFAAQEDQEKFSPLAQRAR
mmetsp:Transcript_6102/g.11169  ORF Transcript_6102/g.11169 Transcript_6102/m.11169 type:complete len:247 (+) Transcript_6102:63-803(+)